MGSDILAFCLAGSEHGDRTGDSFSFSCACPEKAGGTGSDRRFLEFYRIFSCKDCGRVPARCRRIPAFRRAFCRLFKSPGTSGSRSADGESNSGGVFYYFGADLGAFQKSVSGNLFSYGLSSDVYESLKGIESTDPELLEMAEIFQISLPRRIRYIYVSQVLPFFRAGCSVALGLCWKAGIAAEVIGIPDQSIGEMLYNAKVYLNTPDLFAWTVVIVLISLLFEKLFLAGIDWCVARLERI